MKPGARQTHSFAAKVMACDAELAPLKSPSKLINAEELRR